MIRITKMTDYGILLLSRFAMGPDLPVRTVKELSVGAHLPEPTVGKLLKALTKSGLLVSTRGVKGGYRLARRAQEITVAQIISAIDGPIAITDCATADALHRCELEGRCPVQTNWQKINVAIRDSLERITLADMAGPMPGAFVPIASVLDSPQRHEGTKNGRNSLATESPESTETALAGRSLMVGV